MYTFPKAISSLIATRLVVALQIRLRWHFAPLSVVVQSLVFQTLGLCRVLLCRRYILRLGGFPKIDSLTEQFSKGMTLVMSDTIYSLSSGLGRAGVAVIRLSGPDCDDVLLRLCGRLPPFRVASLMTLVDPMTREHLDQGLVLRFERGKSFTGEASCELQVHGGRAVVQAILLVLASMSGLRTAEAGEFTRRALENGRLDLTQVEALADLIDADTEEQRKQALRSLEGFLGREIRTWRETLREIRGLIAAEIDFSDEGDISDNFNVEIDSLLERLQQQFTAALASFEAGRIVSDGFRIALIGPPNAGKSSLLNRLAGSDIAIVTEFAGTTRDVLEVRLDIVGFPVVLIDTAGIRDAIDPVERIGVGRGRFAAAHAHLLLVMEDESGSAFVLPEELRAIQSIRIRSKKDLHERYSSQGVYDDGALLLSAVTGEGLAELRASIADRLRVMADRPETAVLTQERHRILIMRALELCRTARDSMHLGIEFVDENVRGIDHALAEFVGQIGVEEVLGEIFSRFCVGK
jgi:tRNA modification GTPase